MIPALTLALLGTQRPIRVFDPTAEYVIRGTDLNDLEALARRLFMDTALSPDERRDWANRLVLMVRDEATRLEGNERGNPAID